MTHELYKRYRPANFKQVIGQEEAIKYLTAKSKEGKIPHAILFSGPSGVGKTTLARILQGKLDCADQDFAEINCADFRGIEMVRDIRSRMPLSPIGGKSRIWLIDECHKLSGDAQNAILKTLEDTPSHCYFMLATTEPGKLLKTIHTRCTEIKLSLLTHKQIESLILSVLEKEKKKLSEEVIERVVEVAEGSARKALVILDGIIDLTTEEDQLNGIQNSDYRRNAIELARILFKPNVKWPEVANVLKSIDEEAEGLRHLVLAYSTNILLSGGKLAPKAYAVICAFEGNFFDSKKAGLVRACWEVISG